MIYFDSDVLINYLVLQDQKKHDLATELYRRATRDQKFFISFLSLQEVAFVLSKLKVPHEVITQKIRVFLGNNPSHYDLSAFNRACQLAERLGYQNINDCLHTAMAEVNCQELYTFNQADFKRIKSLTTLKISIF